MRVIVNGQIYVYAGRREELWEEVAQEAEIIHNVATNENVPDINKVDSAVDPAADLRLKLRELGVW
jgi:hypothetical protein